MHPALSEVTPLSPSRHRKRLSDLTMRLPCATGTVGAAQEMLAAAPYVSPATRQIGCLREGPLPSGVAMSCVQERRYPDGYEDRQRRRGGPGGGGVRVGDRR